MNEHMMFGAFCILFVSAVLYTTIPKMQHVVLRERMSDDLLVCAQYTAGGSTNQSCQSAKVVREWILANGRPTDECH